MTSRSPLRVGLVGCGTVGRLHAQRLAADPRVALAVLCDPDREAAKRLRDQAAPLAAVETSWETACSRHDLAAAVVCSPTPAHYDQVCLALEQGLDVLCEKPLAPSRGQIQDVLARQKTSGRMVMLSYQRRYKSAYRTARRELRLHGDWYGPLQQVHVFACERWAQSIAGTWRDRPEVAHGYFGDAGSHQIYVAEFICGFEVLSVRARSSRRRAQVEIVTSIWADLAGGAGLAAHYIGDAQHWREDIHFHCRDGDLLVRSEQLWRARENLVEPITELVEASSPDRALVDAILDGMPPASPASCALAAHDFTAAVMRSIHEDRTVALAEFAST